MPQDSSAARRWNSALRIGLQGSRQGERAGVPTYRGQDAGSFK
jgi:hypothetical protein